MMKITYFFYSLFLLSSFYDCVASNEIKNNASEKKENSFYQEHIAPYLSYWTTPTASNLISEVFESDLFFNFVQDTKGAEKLRDIKKNKKLAEEEKIAFIKDPGFFEKVYLPLLEKKQPNKDKQIKELRELHNKLLDQEYKNKETKRDALITKNLTDIEKMIEKDKKIKQIQHDIEILEKDKNKLQHAQEWHESVQLFLQDPSREHAEILAKTFKATERVDHLPSRYDVLKDIIQSAQDGSPEANTLLNSLGNLLHSNNSPDLSSLKNSYGDIEKQIAAIHKDIMQLKNKSKDLENKKEQIVGDTTSKTNISDEINNIKATIDHLNHFKKQAIKLTAALGCINIAFVLIAGYIYSQKKQLSED